MTALHDHAEAHSLRSADEERAYKVVTLPVTGSARATLN